MEKRKETSTRLSVLFYFPQARDQMKATRYFNIQTGDRSVPFCPTAVKYWSNKTVVYQGRPDILTFSYQASMKGQTMKN